MSHNPTLANTNYPEQPSEPTVKVWFEGGSLLIEGLEDQPSWMPEFLQADPRREGFWVCPGIAYRSLIER